MAGSELDGLDGADPEMFVGAVWVLTPAPATADETFAAVAAVVAELGAEVVALPAERHDQVVAVVSHVPHLTAATLMGLASDRAEEHAALLRLAAGGFRDMTRIAVGSPRHLARHLRREPRGDPLGARRADRGAGGDAHRGRPRRPRRAVSPGCSQARDARTNLPSRVNQPSELAEVRIPIPDRPGAAAEIFTLAAELGVNIASFEVVHSVEGNNGVAVVLVDAAEADLFRGGLIARGFRPAVQRLS